MLNTYRVFNLLGRVPSDEKRLEIAVLIHKWLAFYGLVVFLMWVVPYAITNLTGIPVPPISFVIEKYPDRAFRILLFSCTATGAGMISYRELRKIFSYCIHHSELKDLIVAAKMTSDKPMDPKFLSFLLSSSIDGFKGRYYRLYKEEITNHRRLKHQRQTVPGKPKEKQPRIVNFFSGRPETESPEVVAKRQEAKIDHLNKFLVAETKHHGLSREAGELKTEADRAPSPGKRIDLMKRAIAAQILFNEEMDMERKPL